MRVYRRRGRRTGYAILPAFLLLALAPPAWAQTSAPTPDADTHLKISGSVRVRYETLDGQSRVGFGESDDLFAFRTTVLAEYDAHPIRIGAELFDSRVYGSDPGSAVSANDVNAMELVQAYMIADLGGALGEGSRTSIQAGRMTLNLGSRRLVAADDYRNTTNGYTGIRIDARGRDGTSATLIYTLPQVRLPDDPDSVLHNKVAFDRESFDLRLWGGLVAKPRIFAGFMGEIGYFRLQERDAPGRPTRDRQLHSVSARAMREPASSHFDGEAEIIYQFGSVSSGTAAAATRLDVSAWFFHGDVGYTFPGPSKTRLSVEYDRASGDGRGKSYGRFDTLFGMRRAELAPAGIYAQIGRANISTPGIRVETAPTRRLDGFLVYRAMWLASRTDGFSNTGVRDPGGRAGNFAGHQIEGRVRLWLVPKWLRAEVNGAYLAKGNFLRKAPNAPQTGDTRYLSTALMLAF